jgi:lysophospholipase L1-like esterase
MRIVLSLCAVIIASVCPGFAGSQDALIAHLKAGRAQSIVTYGTSLTAGGAWVGQLQGALDRQFPGLTKVVNSGAGAMWSKWGVEHLEERVIGKQPDAVLIEFAINDAFLEYKTSTQQARTNLEQMIDRIVQSHPQCQVILMTMNPPIGVHRERRPKVDDYYEVYRQVARARNLLLIDHHPNWTKVLQEDAATFNRYVPDGIHPDALGCERVILPQLLKSLGLQAPATTTLPPTLVLTSPVDYQVFQREDRSHGAVTVAGTLTFEAKARFRWRGKSLTGAVSEQWVELPVTAVTRAFSLKVTLPAGGWYRLEIQAYNGDTVLAQTQVEHVGMGEVFVVSGQSNSSNWGAEKLVPETGLVASFDGRTWSVADDPQSGCDGSTGGSFIPAFGDALARKYRVPIGVASTGQGATSVRQWLPGGVRVKQQPTTGGMKQVGSGEWESNGGLFNRLVQRCALLGPRGFRAVLWHQGESEAGQSRAGYPADRQITGAQYFEFMTLLIRASREKAGWPVPWFTAQATYHHAGDPADAEFRAAMKKLWDDGASQEGPDTDALREEYRSGVHFNGKGQREHGRLWAEKVGAYLDRELATAARAQLVHKVAEDFEQTPWLPDQWNKAKGQVSLVAEAAPDVRAATSVKMDIAFSGEGFEPFTAVPPQPLWIPGDAKTVTVRFKLSDSRCAFIVGFLDGWGRDRIAGSSLAWDIRPDPSGNWKTATFKVPETWTRPVQIRGITTHNWETQKVKNTLHIQVDDIEVDTDLKDVDPKTGVLTTWKPEPSPANPAQSFRECPRTSLVAVELNTGEEANVFTSNTPAVKIRLKNWKPGELTGKLACQLVDEAGQVVQQFEQPLAVASSAALSTPLKAERFGLYTLNTRVTLSDQTDRTEQMVLARLPVERNLTESEKLASPYGLNVHSGSKTVIQPFKKAGLVWFREYAFAYDWVVRARGEDGRYGGWPYYPKIVGAYTDAGVKCLPVIQKSVEAPAVVGGKVTGRIGPDRQWSREIASLVMAFPQLMHWELSNEYDLAGGNWKVEETIDWANYRAYHRQFANILEIMGGGELTAVENGRAGIWPERLRRCVQSGDFEKIAVVNVHHYCGTDAPEASLSNFNMGSESRLPTLLFDDLRAVKRAAQADGRKRQSWLTEFGWDTLAGPVVSPTEQAVFLPRAWMMALAAGTDKAFWFYNFDAPNPKQFFDGCGLLDAKGEPKLSLCALAGLTSVLPQPHYVGDLEAGTNTCGYVFEDGGKLFASLWRIQGKEGPSVQFQAEQLRDYLGNPIRGDTVRLTMAPVYAVGLSKNDRWFKQTAYSLETPHLVPAAAGDLVCPRVHLTNSRPEAIACRLQLVLPEGWTAEKAAVSASIAPGASQDIDLPFSLPFTEGLGFKEARLVVTEDKQIKQMAVKVLVQSPLTVQISPMEGRPGKTQVTVTVGNRSARPLNGRLTVRVPASWKAFTPEVSIPDLKPQETRAIICPFEWRADWKPEETAQITLDFGADKRITRSLIPNQYALHLAKGIKIDGRLEDWTPETQLPAWMLGSTLGDANATVHLAWAREGLYGAVAVQDSKLLVKDPRSFWAGDALELFLDSADNKQPRVAVSGDHQFWFVPLPDAHRVYLGQWKMKDEIAATRYDLSAMQGVANSTADGYVMEFLLPANQLRNYHPHPGGRLGLNLNLTVQGQQSPREVYWPAPKSSGVPGHPDRWGTVLLLE